jgi:hypothetical protein
LKKTTITVAAFLMLSAIALADDMPVRKEGLWVRHTFQTENPGSKRYEFSQTTCRSHGYDQYERALIKNAFSKQLCSVTESVKGNVDQSNLLCHMAGITIDRKETTTYRGDSSIHFESHATLTPGMDGVTQRTILADEKYTGACPPQLQPGDMISADGKLRHLWKH